MITLSTADRPTCLREPVRIPVQNLLPQLPTRAAAAVFTEALRGLQLLLIRAVPEAHVQSAPHPAALQAAVPREAITAALLTGAVLPLLPPEAAAWAVP